MLVEDAATDVVLEVLVALLTGFELAEPETRNRLGGGHGHDVGGVFHGHARRVDEEVT